MPCMTAFRTRQRGLGAAVMPIGASADGDGLLISLLGAPALLLLGWRPSRSPVAACVCAACLATRNASASTPGVRGIRGRLTAC